MYIRQLAPTPRPFLLVKRDKRKLEILPGCCGNYIATFYIGTERLDLGLSIKLLQVLEVFD